MQSVEKTIISQYANSPTLVNLVHLIDEYIDPSANIDAFYNLVWNVMAEGATLSDYGLDVWGRIVGVSRNLTLPNGSTRPGEPVNLLLSPENFTGPGWSNFTCPVDVDTAIAPNGSMTADTLTDASPGIFSARQQNVTIPADMTTRTFSVDIKKTVGTTSFPGIEVVYVPGPFSGVTVNTNAGTITNWTSGGGSPSAPAAATIVDNGDYWRVSVSVANGGLGTVCAAIIYPAVNTNAGGVWTAAATGSATCWGALLQIGAVASPYNNSESPGTYRLSNADYRTLILVKALANITDSSAASLNRLLSNLFRNRGRCYVLDLGGMKMKLVFEFYLKPFEYAIVTTSGAIPHPVGVQFDIYQIDAANTFGFNEAVNLQPFNQGTFYPG